MFAVSDDLIHAMAGSRAGAASLWYAWRLKAARQKKPGYEPIRRAVALLKKFLHDAGRLQLDELIRRIIDRTGYDVVLLSLPNGRQRSRSFGNSSRLQQDEINFLAASLPKACA